MVMITKAIYTLIWIGLYSIPHVWDIIQRVSYDPGEYEVGILQAIVFVSAL